MSGSINSVTIVGNVVRDPEIRSTQNGDRIANLTVATSERWKGKDGERQEKSEFHKVVVFNDKITDVVEQWVKKGAKIGIQGSLQTRKWTNKDGADQYSTEVVIGRFNGTLTMLGGKQDAEPEAAKPAAAPKAAPKKAADLDDEIPF